MGIISFFQSLLGKRPRPSSRQANSKRLRQRTYLQVEPLEQREVLTTLPPGQESASISDLTLFK